MYEKILLPIDDLDSSGAAISNAKSIAGSMGAAVILFHVVTPENPLITHDEHMSGVHAAPSVVEMAKRNEEAQVEEQKGIFEAVASDNSTDDAEFTAQVIVGDAHREIVNAVKDQDIDLVIISTHGRRGVSRAFLGSVADEVMHDVDVPVMVVKRS